MIDPNYNTILDKGGDSGQTTLSYRKLITSIVATLNYCTEMFHFYLNYIVLFCSSNNTGKNTIIF
jgi:hypothetical protein